MVLDRQVTEALVSYSTGSSTPSTLGKILCLGSLSGPMFWKDEQTLENVFIDAIDSQQMDITKLQNFPGA